MDAELADLMAVGSGALVTAAAGDLWNLIRDSLSHLFGRDRNQGVVTAELELDHARLSAAREVGDSTVADEIQRRWHVELTAAIERDPLAASELRQLLAAVQRQQAAQPMRVRNVVSGGRQGKVIQAGLIEKIIIG